MGAATASLDCLRAIKDLGVYVGIDDFGTGHSSLARLRSLPVEVLKVDRSFVDGLGTEHEDSAVVAAVLSLAHALGLHVIAEGVETPLQANQLIALGCPVAQGFLWSPAVPAEQIPAHGGARHRRAPARHRASRRAQPGRRDDAPDRHRQGGPEVTVVAGILALLTGIAYTGLGVITAYELMRHRRSRGFSHFGAAFLVMAFTCGPHHLVHAWRHLIAGEPAHGPMIAALAIGLAPGADLHRPARRGGVRRPRRPADRRHAAVAGADPGADGDRRRRRAVGGAAPRGRDGRRPARADPERDPVRQLLPRRLLHRPHAARPPPRAGRLVAVGRGDERRLHDLRGLAPGRRAC